MESIKNIRGIENIEASFPGITKEIDDLIERANNGFTQGYTCACANLVRLTGDPGGTTECELLQQSVSSKAGLMKHKVDEEDLRILMPTIKELERKRKLIRPRHRKYNT